MQTRYPHARLIIRAYDAHGYQKDILLQSLTQVHRHDSRLSNGLQGMIIDPKEFPEMVRFEIILEPIY